MNLEITERIITIRKTLNLKQRHFAQRLGIRQSTLSNIETGQNGVTNANIRLICVTFNINEVWLRSGAGPMFQNSAPGSPDETELLETFRQLLPPIKKVVMNLIRDLLEAQGETSADH
jgi:transcriptional regulator with XRE-family HTH domain